MLKTINRLTPEPVLILILSCFSLGKDWDSFGSVTVKNDNSYMTDSTVSLYLAGVATHI